jgi:hypothetical protein
MAVTIKLTTYPAKGKHLVNTPRTHLQRQPRVYTHADRAGDRVADLQRLAPDATVVELVQR